MLTSAMPLALVVVAIVGLAVTGNLFSTSPYVIAAQVIAVALNLWARLSFDKGTFRVSAAPAGAAVMRRGPYRLVRHPMYLAALVFVWAGIVSHASAVALIIGSGLTGVVVARVLAEERLLRAKYPDYDVYTRTTNALVPYLF
jgi:protein-S-isoprenylcysteine O-methyltransferase Ste14